MKFNFFFISYSVIYAKYNYCYEIPRDLPVRYFDGKEWKFMKPRHIFRTKAPSYTNISTELDWADLIKEIGEIELQETTTQMPPNCGGIKTKTKTTTERTTRVKTTTKKTTTKKLTTKITTPKTIVWKVRPPTKPTKTTKTAAKHSPAPCKLKLKTTTTRPINDDWINAWTRVRPTKKLCPVGQEFLVDPSHCKLQLETTTATTIDPLIWQMKMITGEDWINAWTRVRPTKKLCPVGQEFLGDPSQCKLQLETTTATTIDPLIWQMKTSEDWINIWTRVRPSKKPSPVTAKINTPKNLPASKTKATLTTTMDPVTTTEKSVDISGIQGNDGNGPENWSNLMKEFLKFVESKKCRPPCDYGTTTPTPFSGYILGDKRIRAGADDLTSILMDGVEIDDKLSEIDDDTSQGNAIMQFKETYEADRGQIFNYDSVDGFVSRDSKINNDNVQDLDDKSFKDSVQVRRIKQDEETAQYPKKIKLLKEMKSKNLKQDYKIPRISRSGAYLDELKFKNEINDDEVIQDNEIHSYIDVLKDKHSKKQKDSEKEAYLDAENAKYIRKAQDKDIRKRLDTIKDMYIHRHKDNSQYISKDPLNFKELNRMADFVATKSTYSTDSTEMINDNEDFLQDRDKAFVLGTLESDHEEADKYSTENIEVRDSDVYPYEDTVNDIYEQKNDKTINSYENNIIQY